jgi:hypothetical protein
VVCAGINSSGRVFMYREWEPCCLVALGAVLRSCSAVFAFGSPTCDHWWPVTSGSVSVK